jgi:hypothetical protein
VLATPKRRAIAKSTLNAVFIAATPKSERGGKDRAQEVLTSSLRRMMWDRPQLELLSAAHREKKRDQSQPENYKADDSYNRPIVDRRPILKAPGIARHMLLCRKPALQVGDCFVNRL